MWRIRRVSTSTSVILLGGSCTSCHSLFRRDHRVKSGAAAAKIAKWRKCHIMKSMKKHLSRATSLFLSSVMLFGTMTTGVFAAENGASKNTSADKFTPKVTYQVTVTDAERAKIHAAVDNLSGYVGDMVVGDKSYDPNTLIGGLATGSSYNSISYGSKNAGSVPSQYPFTVPSTATNRKGIKISCKSIIFPSVKGI